MLDTLDSADLRDFLHAHIQVVIAEANEAGFGTAEILAELRDILDKQRLAYDADPDPAEDPDPDNAAPDIDPGREIPRGG